MNKSLWKHGRGNRRGIALVIVLGMLALLLMMGVTFSIFMRTEREAAGSFTHEVRARHLLLAAQVRAIDDLNEDLRNLPYPDWPVFYPPLPVPADAKRQLRLSLNDIWSQHVPDALAAKFPTNIGWVDLPEGRVSYVVFNASGLIDANVAGGAVLRTNGTSPSEIDVEGLVSDVAAWSTFRNKRPYETVAEMKIRKAAIGLKTAYCLSDFSRFGDITPGLVSLSGDATQLALKKTDIMNAFSRSFSQIDADMVYEALLDYVDADSIPRRLDYPCVERVPMINEVRVQPRGRVNGTGINISFRTLIEVMYPFITPMSGNFRFECNAEIQLVNPPPGLTIATNVTGATAEFTPYPGVFNNYTVTLDPPSFVDCTLYGGQTLTFSIKFTSIVMKRGSDTIDQVLELDLSRAAAYATLVVPVAPAAASGTFAGMECADPRYNHFVSQFWQTHKRLANAPYNGDPVNGSIDPPRTNSYAAYLLSQNTDGDSWMHVADHPLRSLGELTYLPRGGSLRTDTAWKTLRFLADRGGAADPILSAFCLTAQTNRGWINPNTHVSEVMQAALRDMPLDCAPGDPNEDVLVITPAQALNLATNWIGDPTCGTYWSLAATVSNSNFKTALAQYVDAAIVNLPSGVPKARQFRYEAGYRNLVGLMNPRQNYFIIILFAQSKANLTLQASFSSTPTVRSSQAAVLELWRDPLRIVVTNGASVHTNYPMIVRRFDVLSQD